MKHLFVLLFSVGVMAENPYSTISKRNAFELTQEPPPVITILDKIETPKIQLFLTGITRLRGVTKAHMYSKDLPNKYLSLRVGDQSGSVRVLSISRDVVTVVNGGKKETLSFAFNRLKTTVVKKDNSTEGDRDKRRRQYDEWRKSRE